MFKLIKITNSVANVPELETLPKSASLKIRPGEAVVMSNGKLGRCGMYDIPQFLALSDGTGGETKVTVCRITPDMVFEADYVGEIDLEYGLRLTIAADENGSSSVLSNPDNDAGVATVVGFNEGKPIVIFN